MVVGRCAILLCVAGYHVAGVAGQAASCSFKTPTGSQVSLSSLNSPSGNKVVTPLGNALINPCSKVTLCDAMQTGSTCCVQVNDTLPGSARWINCGMTPKFAPLGGVGTSMGIVLDDGPDCGYVFAPGQKVQASISFKCDRSATGYGRVTADTTAFMKQPVSTGGFGGGAAKAVFRPELFCNMNFTWSTSLVCGLPIPDANRGASWGLPVLLVLLGVGAVYFGGGAYMNSKQPGADPSLANNIPNKEFWDEIPAMVSDGIAFVASGGQKQAHYSQFKYDDVGEASAPKKKKKKKKLALPSSDGGDVSESLVDEAGNGGTPNGDTDGGGADDFIE